MPDIKYRKDIDALRGISVLLVIVFHAFPELLPGGFIGVDVFFVISGYLITSIIYSQLIQNNFSFLNFYKRRIRRIFPALFTVLLASLIIGWLILFPDEYRQLGDHISYAAIFIQNFCLINELGYFDVSSHYKPLLHLWTLSIEEQFYLFWPAILLLIYKSRFNPAFFLLGLIILSFTTNLVLVSDYKDEVFFHSGTRFWELGIGSLLAILIFQNHHTIIFFRRINSKFGFILGLSSIIFAAVWLNGESLYPYWFGLIPTLATALIIMSNLELPNWGGLVKLGLISYPLYLWHWVLISFFYIYLGQKPSPMLLLAAIVISFLFSILTVKYIEWIRRTSSNKIVFAVVMLAFFTGSGGLVASTSDGAPNRKQLDYLDKYLQEFERIPSTDDQCNAYARSRTDSGASFTYCRSNLADDPGKRIAIIGDSHASVLFPGISSIARKRGYDTIMVANSGCPPLIGFPWGRNAKEIKDCQQKIDDMIQLIRSDKKTEKVIITTRGPVYIHGEIKGKHTRESVQQSLDRFEDPEKRTYESYIKGFEKLCLQLAAFSHIKSIYYVLENPELDFLPKEVIRRPYDFWGVTKQDSSVDRRLYRLRMKKYRDLVYQKSALIPKVHIIDVEPFLCQQNKCDVYQNNNFLYADDDHYSVFGSYYLSKKIEHTIFDHSAPTNP